MSNIFKCVGCGEECILITNDDTVKPFTCPYEYVSYDWKEVKDDIRNNN